MSNALRIYDAPENPTIPITEWQATILIQHAHSCNICSMIKGAFGLMDKDDPSDPDQMCVRINKLDYWDRSVEQHLTRLMSHHWSMADFKLGSVWDVVDRGEPRRAVIRAIRADEWLTDAGVREVNAFYSLTDYAGGQLISKKMIEINEFMEMVIARKIGDFDHE